MSPPSTGTARWWVAYDALAAVGFVLAAWSYVAWS